MIGITDISLVFQAAVCIVALTFLLLRLWAEHRLDAFRQEMFAIRDELFDYAADGNISFDNPSYRLLRRSMNGFIRYAHQLTFFRFCMTMLELKLAGKTTESKWTEEWRNALQGIRDNKVKSTLEKFHDRTMECAAYRLIFGSPVLLSLAICSIPVLIVRMGLQNLHQILSKAPIFTVSHIVDTRIIENQAAAAALA
jgi:hypothetical protein